MADTPASTRRDYNSLYYFVSQQHAGGTIGRAINRLAAPTITAAGEAALAKIIERAQTPDVLSGSSLIDIGEGNAPAVLRTVGLAWPGEPSLRVLFQSRVQGILGKPRRVREDEWFIQINGDELRLDLDSRSFGRALPYAISSGDLPKSFRDFMAQIKKATEPYLGSARKPVVMAEFREYRQILPIDIGALSSDLVNEVTLDDSFTWGTPGEPRPDVNPAAVEAINGAAGNAQRYIALNAAPSSETVEVLEQQATLARLIERHDLADTLAAWAQQRSAELVEHSPSSRLANAQLATLQRTARDHPLTPDEQQELRIITEQLTQHDGIIAESTLDALRFTAETYAQTDQHHNAARAWTAYADRLEQRQALVPWKSVGHDNPVLGALIQASQQFRFDDDLTSALNASGRAMTFINEGRGDSMAARVDHITNLALDGQYPSALVHREAATAVALADRSSMWGNAQILIDSLRTPAEIMWQNGSTENAVAFIRTATRLGRLTDRHAETVRSIATWMGRNRRPDVASDLLEVTRRPGEDLTPHLETALAAARGDDSDGVYLERFRSLVGAIEEQRQTIVRRTRGVDPDAMLEDANALSARRRLLDRFEPALTVLGDASPSPAMLLG